VFAVHEEDTAAHIAVPGKVFGEAVDHQVGAVREGLEEKRRRERRIDE